MKILFIALSLFTTVDDYGDEYYRIFNEKNYSVQCVVRGIDDPYYIQDFYIYPNQYSRWYPSPRGRYNWQCR